MREEADPPISQEFEERQPARQADVILAWVAAAALGQSLILQAAASLDVDIFWSRQDLNPLEWMMAYFLCVFILGLGGFFAGLAGFRRNGRKRCIVLALGNLGATLWPLAALLFAFF